MLSADESLKLTSKLRNRVRRHRQRTRLVLLGLERLRLVLSKLERLGLVLSKLERLGLVLSKLERLGLGGALRCLRALLPICNGMG